MSWGRDHYTRWELRLDCSCSFRCEPPRVPVPQHHDDLLGRCVVLVVVLDHQEALAVGRHVVVGRSSARSAAGAAHAVRVVSFPQFLGTTGRKRGSARHRHGHHAVAVAIVKLAASSLPHRIGAAIARDLDLRTRPRKRLHVHLQLCRTHSNNTPATGRQARTWATWGALPLANGSAWWPPSSDSTMMLR